MAEVSEEHQQQAHLPDEQQQEEPAIVDSAGENKDKKKTSPPSFNPSSFSLNIWPPSQRTREAVINRLLETLSSPSVLSKRYGSIHHDEASAVARQIEQEAFSAASSFVSSSPAPDSDDGGTITVEDDGIETLQFYSKEISKRMLESVKARASSSSSSSTMEIPLTAVDSSVAAAPAVSEDISSVGSETSQA